MVIVIHVPLGRSGKMRIVRSENSFPLSDEPGQPNDWSETTNWVDGLRLGRNKDGPTLSASDQLVVLEVGHTFYKPHMASYQMERNGQLKPL